MHSTPHQPHHPAQVPSTRLPPLPAHAAVSTIAQIDPDFSERKRLFSLLLERPSSRGATAKPPLDPRQLQAIAPVSQDGFSTFQHDSGALQPADGARLTPVKVSAAPSKRSSWSRLPRPHTSDSSSKASKSSQPAALLQRPSAKQDKLDWCKGPNRPELVSEPCHKPVHTPVSGHRAASDAVGFTMSISATVASLKQEAPASSEALPDSIDGQLLRDNPRKTHTMSLVPPTLPLANASRESRRGSLTDAPWDASIAPQQPFTSKMRTAANRIEKHRGSGPDAEYDGTGAGVGHWTTELGASIRTPGIGATLADGMDASSLADRRAYLRPSASRILSRPLLASTTSTDLARPGLDTHFESVSSHFRTSSIDSFGSSSRESSTDTHSATFNDGASDRASTNHSSTEVDQSSSISDAHQLPLCQLRARNEPIDRLPGVEPTGPAHTDDLGLDMPHRQTADRGPSKKKAITLSITTRDERGADAAVQVDASLTSASSETSSSPTLPQLPVSRAPSIVSSSTPRRISFAPSVRSRNRPAPKGIAPPGILFTPSPARIVASSDAASEAEVGPAEEMEPTIRVSDREGRQISSNKRENRASSTQGPSRNGHGSMRPSTAPAVLEREDDDASRGRFVRSNEDSEGMNGDDGADNEGDIFSFRWSRRRIRTAHAKDEHGGRSDEVEVHRDAGQYEHEHAGAGAEAGTQPAVAGPSEDPSDATPPCDTEDACGSTHAATTSELERLTPELLFYPGTLILVRDSDKLLGAEAAEDGCCADAEATDDASKPGGQGKTDESSAASEGEANERRSSLFDFKRWSSGRRRLNSTTSRPQTSAAAEYEVDDNQRRNATPPEATPAASTAPGPVTGSFPPQVGANADAAVCRAPRHGTAQPTRSRCHAEPNVPPRQDSTEAPPYEAPTAVQATAGAHAATGRSVTSASPEDRKAVALPVVEDEAGLVLWHGAPPDQATGMRTKVLRLLKRICLPRNATKRRSLGASLSSPPSRADDKPMVRIVSKDGQSRLPRRSSILLPESAERPYYFPLPTKMDFDWHTAHQHQHQHQRHQHQHDHHRRSRSQVT
ncbi:hypothetical protein ACQY0O_001207 [Thecaphora frezii]